MIKRHLPPLSLAQLCESARNELENNSLETVKIDLREDEAEKARKELYARLKQQLANLEATESQGEKTT